MFLRPLWWKSEKKKGDGRQDVYEIDGEESRKKSVRETDWAQSENLIT